MHTDLSLDSMNIAITNLVLVGATKYMMQTLRFVN